MNRPGEIHSVFVQPNDQIIVFGNFNWVGPVARNHIARLHPSGTLDLIFDPGADFSDVYSCALQADGKLLIAGKLNTGQTQILRYNPDGHRDDSFFTPFIGVSNSDSRLRIQVTGDGRVLLTGNFYFSGDRYWRHLARLDPHGSIDASFVPNTNNERQQDFWRTFPQPDGSIIAATAEDYDCVRLHGDGTFDRRLAGYRVEAVVRQADGKLLLAGEFYGPEHYQVMRLNKDFTIDASYRLVVEGGDMAENAVALRDGRILVQVPGRIALLETNGVLIRIIENAGGALPYATVNPAAQNANGGILLPSIWNYFATNQTNFGLIRVDAAGRRDPTFSLRGGVMTWCGPVEVLPLGDGKILVSGEFTHVNGHERMGTVRLLKNGSIDTNADFKRDARLPLSGRSGRYFVGPNWFCDDYECTQGLGRWFPDGRRDRSFAYYVWGEYVSQVFPLPGGKTLIAKDRRPGPLGDIDYVVIDSFGEAKGGLSLQSRNQFSSAPGTIHSLIRWSTNGSVMIAGGFNLVNGIQRLGIVRLLPNLRVDLSFNPPPLSQPIRTVHRLPGDRVGVVTGYNELAALDAEGNLLWMRNIPKMDVKTSWGNGDRSSYVAGEIAERQTRLLRFSPGGHLIGGVDVPFQKLSEYDEQYATPIWVKDHQGRALIGGSSLIVHGKPFSGIKRLRRNALDNGNLELQTDSAEAVLRLHGVPGRTYLVDKSTDLTNWQTLAEVTLTNSWSATLNVQSSNAPAEFYRTGMRLP